MPDDFHAAFRAALAGDPAALAPWASGAAAQAGLAVHRNSIAKACIDAVLAQFPTVARVVGEDWLAGAAVEFSRAHPPRRASLLDYGEAFPEWIAAFGPARELPYLGGLARLDWLSTMCDLAADAPALDPARVAALGPDDFAGHALDLHPATQLAGFEDSIPSLWLALAAGDAQAHMLDDRPEGIVFLRPGLAQGHRLLSAGGFAFLDAAGRGESLASAAARALAAEPDFDLAPAFADLLVGGAFTAMRTLP